MVNFKFINDREGSARKGYVPTPETSQSGVTIANGFDIGQHSKQQILNAFNKVLANKLLPYVGLIKQGALDKLEEIPLNITADEAKEINDYSHNKALTTLRNLWQNSKATVAFDNLPSNKQTAVASVAFQYGNLASRTPNFWHQVTSGDWLAAKANLRKFGDDYSPRRNLEADLLESEVA